jgi:PAS domain S-box-containing protein
MNTDASKTPTAIVVNDDATQRKVLTALLTRGGMDVQDFDGAEAALTALAAGLRPDLIVTDLYMPGIDGWRFCRLLRSPEYQEFNATPILVVSATFSGEEPAQITIGLGANAFVPQPVEPRQLLDTVDALLRNETPLHNPRVLIVEDETIMARLLQKTFEEHGYKADTAFTGKEALGKFDGQTNVVVLDYHLPDMEGDDLLVEFRRQCPGCAVIMITDDTDPDLALAWMKAGGAAYACKPCDPKYVVELCARASRERAFIRAEVMLEDRTRALRESEERFRDLAEMLPEAIFECDAEMNLTYGNQKALDLSGYSKEDLARGLNGLELLVPEDRERARETVARRMKSELVGSREYRAQRKDDSTFPVFFNMTPIMKEEAIVGFRGVVIDLTQQRSMEARLRHAQKLESIGTLADGVAHEINNPTNGIMNYAQLILDQLGPDSPVSEFAREIEKETNRVAAIVRHLLSFARPDKGEHSHEQIGDILSANLSLFRSVLQGDQIKLQLDVPADLPAIRCRGYQIQQVIMNLLTNARDTLNEKYTSPDPDKMITITAREMSHHASGERLVRLTVEDHGTGIDPKVREHLFVPFYTSKRPGAGTGLGLSISHTIVKEHGGELSVESEVGKWTRFHVDLPIKRNGDRNVERGKGSLSG